MKTKPAYLVIDTHGRTPTISHVRAGWPSLYPGQIVVRVSIEIPDSLLPNIQEVVLDDPGSMAVAVDGVEIQT